MRRTESSAAGDALAKSNALKAQASLVVARADGSPTLRDSDIAYTAATIEDAARRLSEEVPFPPGLNSASHIDWATAIDGGIGGTAMSDVMLRRVIQANAERDWAWYAARNVLTAQQRQIVADVSQWSGRRPLRPGHQRLTDLVLSMGPTEEARAVTTRAYGGGAPRTSRW